MSQVTVVSADRRTTLGFGELWRGRELLYFLAKRQIQVTYQQSLLGLGWVIAQPVITMGVFTVFFGNLARLPAAGLPYTVFYVSGLVPFTYLRSSIGKSTTSLSANKQLVTKVYIPRLLLPLAPAVSELVALLIGVVIVVVVVLLEGLSIGTSLVLLPAWTLLLVSLALAVGLWTSAVNAIFRDVAFAVGYGLQLLMFVSPVTYGIDLVPERFQTLYYLNPFATAVDGFRSSLTGMEPPPTVAIVAVCAATLLTIVVGAAFFRRMESAVADAV